MATESQSCGGCLVIVGAVCVPAALWGLLGFGVALMAVGALAIMPRPQWRTYARVKPPEPIPPWKRPGFVAPPPPPRKKD